MKYAVTAFSLLLSGAAMQSPPQVVSLYSLVANPAQHSGSRVSTVGFLNIAEMMICVDEASAKKPVFSNCIPLGGVKGADDELTGDYVQVIGYFDAAELKPRRHVASIRNVESIRPYRP
jgi:hypothetical protein